MTGAWVLVAEDERQARESLCALLEEDGYRVVGAADGSEAEQLLARRSVDAVLLDVRMPGKDGLALLRDLQQSENPPAVLVMTAYGSSHVAIEAMALGAYDYLSKPINLEELRMQLRRAIESRRHQRELESYRIEQQEAVESEMAGNGPAMQALYKQIGQVAPTNSTVLIRGESGTGKELVARALHSHSGRPERRLVKVNCASIPETLLEAELFGHEKGAFTGAAQRRIGKFEYAHGGTIFLDEIGELSLATQAKLLRVLQEREIERLGSNLTITLDVRVLAATNQALEEVVRQGSFREDLYYRLNVVTIRVPALRERREDIPELAAYLLRRCARRLGFAEAGLSAEAMKTLEARSYPGNVRELEHLLERALVLSRGGVVTAAHLETEAAPPSLSEFPESLLEAGWHEAVARLERWMIREALARAGGNRTRAAESLGIHRRLLYDKLKEHHFDGPPPGRE